MAWLTNLRFGGTIKDFTESKPKLQTPIVKTSCGGSETYSRKVTYYLSIYSMGKDLRRYISSPYACNWIYS